LPSRPDGTRVLGEWLRHAAAGLPPLPPREDAPDNRGQRCRVVDALYLAESEATVWAEWYRHLAESGIPPQRALPRDLWRWSVETEVADLGTEEKLAELGLRRPRPAGARGRRFRPSVRSSGATGGAASSLRAPRDRPG